MMLNFFEVHNRQITSVVSSPKPILEFQTFDFLKFFEVVRDQRRVQGEGMGCNLKIVRTNDFSGTLEVGAQLTATVSAFGVEVNYGNGCQELVERGSAGWRTAFARTVAQLEQHDARDADVVQVLLSEYLSHVRWTPVDDVNADVGVQHEFHFQSPQSRSSAWVGWLRSIGSSAFFYGFGDQQHAVANSFDKNFAAFKTEGFGQAHGLAASGLKKFCGVHDFLQKYLSKSIYQF
jgi:hypothetical protein